MTRNRLQDQRQSTYWQGLWDSLTEEEREQYRQEGKIDG